MWRTNVKATKTHRARRDASGYVFVGRDGVKPVCSTWPLATVKRIQKRAGAVSVDADGKERGKRTFHEHRHTAATVMLTAGKPLPVVARQLGHASSEITARVYEHLLDDALLDDALAAFEGSRVARDVARDREQSGETAQTRM